MKVKLLECVRLCGKAVKPFIGEKSYISTGALDENKINNNQIEKVTYAKKPSRANLQVDNGSVIFAKMQNTKKALLIDEELSKNIYSTGFFAFLPIEGVISQKCLFYLINSNYFLKLKDKNCSGATQKAITNEGLEKIELNVPTLDDQEKLVQQLKKINYLQDKYQSQLKRLDTLIKSRFVEMFGDIVYNDKKWDTEKLNGVCPFNKYNGDIEEKNGQVWILNLDMVESNSGRVIDYVYIKNNEIPSSTIKFDKNYVLYSKLRPYLNKVVIPNRSGYGTSELIAIECNDKINKYYLAEGLRSQSFVDEINATSYGAKMPRASVDWLKNFNMPIPPIELQNDFASFVDQVDKSKFAVQEALNKTKMLMDSLMQEYFG